MSRGHVGVGRKKRNGSHVGVHVVVMLVSPTNPPGIELCSYASIFFVLVEKRAH